MCYTKTTGKREQEITRTHDASATRPANACPTANGTWGVTCTNSLATRPPWVTEGNINSSAENTTSCLATKSAAYMAA